MRARRAEVFSLLLVGVLTAFIGFHALNGALRQVEEAAVIGLLSGLGSRISLVAGHQFQVLPPDHEAFRAQLTPYCSSIVSILALAVIVLFVLRAPWRRRLLALAAGIALVLVCNILRVSGSVWMGYEFGPGSLVLFHDWVGTVFALAYTMAGFFLMLSMLLPGATERIPRAARVSDVL